MTLTDRELLDVLCQAVADDSVESASACRYLLQKTKLRPQEITRNLLNAIGQRRKESPECATHSHKES